MLAATEDGIPDGMEGTDKTFTLEALRQEIAAEVEQELGKERVASVSSQLQAGLLGSAVVQCDWGRLSEEEVQAERLAAVILAVAEREGYANSIDMDEIKKKTWDVLGKPKAGTNIAEVGSDPARDFEKANQDVLRKERLALVMEHLERSAQMA